MFVNALDACVCVVGVRVNFGLFRSTEKKLEVTIHHELRQQIFYVKILTANALHRITISMTCYQLHPITCNVENNLQYNSSIVPRYINSTECVVRMVYTEVAILCDSIFYWSFYIRLFERLTPAPMMSLNVNNLLCYYGTARPLYRLQHLLSLQASHPRILLIEAINRDT